MNIRHPEISIAWDDLERLSIAGRRDAEAFLTKYYTTERNLPIAIAQNLVENEVDLEEASLLSIRDKDGSTLASAVTRLEQISDIIPYESMATIALEKLSTAVGKRRRGIRLGAMALSTSMDNDLIGSVVLSTLSAVRDKFSSARSVSLLVPWTNNSSGRLGDVISGLGGKQSPKVSQLYDGIDMTRHELPLSILDALNNRRSVR